MLDYTNELRPSLDEYLQSNLREAHHQTENAINDAKEGIINRQIHSGVRPLEEYIRSLREQVIRRYIAVKNNFNHEILRFVRTASTIEDLVQLSKLEKNLEAEKATKDQISNELAVYQTEKGYEGYELFEQYNSGATWRTRGKSHNGERSDTITAAVSELYDRYIKKKIWFFIIGLLVSLGCAAMDFSLLQSVLISANLPRASAFSSAIIAAAALDVPPFFLGFVRAKRNDDERLPGEITDAPDNPKTFLKVASILLRIVIGLAIAIYVLVRLLMFLGGGDFNAALHAVFSWEFNFQNIKFDSADILTISIPLVTSAVAYAVSLLLSVPYTDFVRSAIARIKAGLAQKELNCQDRAAETNAHIRTIENDIADKQAAIQATLLGSEVKISQKDFTKEVVKAYRRYALPQIQQEYELCSAKIRDECERDLSAIKLGLIPFAQAAEKISSMDFSDTEKSLLDEIWAKDTPSAQGSETTKTKEQLKNSINEIKSIYEP